MTKKNYSLPPSAYPLIRRCDEEMHDRKVKKSVPPGKIRDASVSFSVACCYKDLPEMCILVDIEEL